MVRSLAKFAPLYAPVDFGHPKAAWALAPFVTSLTAPIYSFRSHLLTPQLLGALFSRASRAAGDLRYIFWKEYIEPILMPKDDTPEARQDAKDLVEFIKFYHKHKRLPYNTERAYAFFAKWLSGFGDDSIAQMASTNLIATVLSQTAIKFLEDQRIGIAPIEKSTRYVDYSMEVNGQFMYYLDPRLADWGLEGQYRELMNQLFAAYSSNIPRLTDAFVARYPDVGRATLEKKAFDTLRGLLPMATLSQVAWHGNAQAFKYMIDRCSKHPRGELRWFAKLARKALNEEIPALLLHLDDERNKDYQSYLVKRRARVRKAALPFFPREFYNFSSYVAPEVQIAEYDKDGENKVIAGLIYAEADGNISWNEIMHRVAECTPVEKKAILDAHFKGRKYRWEKVARAFENAYVRFEIVMNVGAYRDLHRHRMHTQERQKFTTRLGYQLPAEKTVDECGLTDDIRGLMTKAGRLYEVVCAHDPEVAQDVATLFHFVRFYQYQNLRQFFWEVELRTGPQGHLDYRYIEQEKFRLLREVYPLICSYVLADMSMYEIARRGQEERAAEKEAKIQGCIKNLSK